jgi:FKBP-type peptidyl-prolyl cis-trans isomerase SlpA
MPGQAFGMRDEKAIQLVEKSRFPADMRLEPGQIVGFSGADGEEIAGAVLEVHDQQVKVDFNHPLAGREIIFESLIVEVTNPPSEADIPGQ